MIGMQSANVKSIPPFAIVNGVPSKLLKFNRVGAERRGFSKEELDEVENNFFEIIVNDSSSENPIVKVINEFKKLHNNYLTQ